MKKLKEFLPHLCISLSMALATVAIVDGRNPLMKFLTSTPSKILIFALCAVCFITALVQIISSSRNR